MLFSQLTCRNSSKRGPEWSPKATEGWYVVYLFAADGSAVFLSLNQGTTDWINGGAVAKDPKVLAERSEAARSVLRKSALNLDAISPEIELRDPGNLGKGYRSIIEYEIKPLLREYWFDDPDKANKEIERLTGGNPD
jgi:hypothetical protein